MSRKYKLFNYFIDVNTKDGTVNWNRNSKLKIKQVICRVFRICILESGLAVARPVAVKQNEDI